MMTPKLLTLLAVLTLSTAPDEGQWLPIQIRNMDWTELRARGMKLSKDEFWHPTKGGVLSAAIHFNFGCTASFVSDEGLVITNHHCGFGAISAASTVETNHLRDGFVAKTRAEEIPTSMTVSVVRKIEDVTKKVHAAQQRAQSPAQRVRITEAITRQIAQEAETDENTSCKVTSLFEGREYHLYYSTVLRDVRLVYAPPRSVGEYGGEVDNWEWPRHTGDFSFFRAYVSPEGKPATYAKDNVPFKPEHYLGVSEKGVQENDLVFIMGFPGKTERYLTSVAVADRQGVYFPLRHTLMTNTIRRIEAACEGNEAKTLAWSSTVKSLANVQKNALGMIKGLARNATVQIKREQEAAFRSWVEQDEGRKAKYGSVLDELMVLDRKANETSAKDLVFVQFMNTRTVPLFRRTVDVLRSGFRTRKSFEDEAVEKGLSDIQLPILADLIEEARRLPESQRLAAIDSFPKGEALGVLRDAIKTSPLRDAASRKALIDGGREAIQNSKDPILRLAIGIAAETNAYLRRQQLDQGQRLVLGPKWIEAQQEFRGKSFYPDANSTLRVSIASVKGYEPRDGVVYTPHTTVAGLLAKDTGKSPFNVPTALKQAAEKRQDSSYYDAKIGDVPVCFLSDGDTTGGNSGSPLINGKGQFVGINFDRAFESVSGDFGWNPERSRNISVDVRYILWQLEQVMPAPHLLVEMRKATAKLGR